MVNSVESLHKQIGDLDAKIDRLQRNIRDNEFQVYQAQIERLEAQKSLIRLQREARHERS
ncbi:MAG: hypothetical protein RLZZ175_2789 [Bacteroidota bacterium]|jgi:uncharacterized small protein (DUF1192 family)